MVKVKINKTNEYINEFTIKGHANSAETPGQFDLVCAGVSAVVMGILNSLDIKHVDVEVNEGFVSIKVNKFSIENEFILKILQTSLLTIEESYGNYISVKEEIL